MADDSKAAEQLMRASIAEKFGRVRDLLKDVEDGLDGLDELLLSFATLFAQMQRGGRVDLNKRRAAATVAAQNLKALRDHIAMNRRELEDSLRKYEATAGSDLPPEGFHS